jgi:hypothetical protein
VNHPGFRCTAASVGREEDLAGTASTVRAFVLVECPGPWGPDAVAENRLPREFDVFAAAAAGARVRVLLIRRPARRTTRPGRVFAAYAGRDRHWLEVGGFGDLHGLDLAGLGRGRTAGLARTDEDLFCVCTHGRHDVCCAQLGRPVAATLAAAFPEQTWEVSHIGGDRFAANLLVLPAGLYYGRVDAGEVVALAEAHTGGEITVDRLRGRTSIGFAAQAAEVFLRRSTGLAGLHALRLTGHDVDGELTTATFRTPEGAGWRVVVHVEHAPPAQLTCRARREGRAPVHRLLAIEPLG